MTQSTKDARPVVMVLWAIALGLGAAGEVRAQPADEGADALTAPRPRGAAAAARAPNPLALDVSVGTHFPVSVGGEVTLELPGRLLTQLHVGWLPRGYLGLVNGVGTGLGWYDGQTARGIEAALDDAMLIRPALGWRPFPDGGLELYLGYTLATLGGGATKAELTGAEFPGSDERVTLSGKAHAIHAVMGWRWLPAEHLVVRAGLGYTNVLGADVTVGQGDNPRHQRAGRVIEEALTEYVQTLELRLTLGFRL